MHLVCIHVHSYLHVMIVQKVDCSAATTANPFGIWLVFFSEHNKYQGIDCSVVYYY